MHTPALRPGLPALPAVVLAFSACMWGITWWPLKQFGAAGLAGPMLALLSYGVVGVVGLPWLWRERRAWASEWGKLGAIALFGGWANASFVSALVIGDVLRVMLLFYLAPVWSVIGGWLFLREPVGGLRALAVGLALAGAFFLIGGTAAFAAPPTLADLLALSAGIAFAGNNLATRAARRVPLLSKTVATFFGCGLIAALVVLGQHLPAPAIALPVGLALLAFSFLWLGLATATTAYGVSHLQAGQAALILLCELLAAVLSAVLLDQRSLLPREILGGALILVGAGLDVLKTKELT